MKNELMKALVAECYGKSLLDSYLKKGRTIEEMADGIYLNIADEQWGRIGDSQTVLEFCEELEETLFDYSGITIRTDSRHIRSVVEDMVNAAEKDDMRQLQKTVKMQGEFLIELTNRIDGDFNKILQRVPPAPIAKEPADLEPASLPEPADYTQLFENAKELFMTLGGIGDKNARIVSGLVNALEAVQLKNKEIERERKELVEAIYNIRNEIKKLAI